MPDRRTFSRRLRVKSPGSGLSSIDPQLPHASAPSLQVPQANVTASETAQEGNDASIILSGSSHDSRPSPSFRHRLLKGIRRRPNPKRSHKSTMSPPGQPMSTTLLQSSPHNPPLSPPSLDSGEGIDHPRSTLNTDTLHDTGTRGQPEPADVNSPNSASSSVPALSVLSSSGTDRKKTIIGATKLLLQTAAVALKFSPIANLDQIPNTLLTWIGIYETVTGSTGDIEQLCTVIEQMQHSVLQPLEEWTGEVPSELKDLIQHFCAALEKQVEDIGAVKGQHVAKRTIQAAYITRQISAMNSILNDAINRFQLRMLTLTQQQTSTPA